jgi:histidinol-phosphate aminotransferase
VTDLPIRDDLRGVHAYGAPQLPHAIQLNVNENPYPPSAELTAALGTAVAEAAATLNRYPDREAVALRAALAGYLGHGLTADTVWAANGSNEVLLQLLLAFGGPGRTALGFEPSYSMHREIARTTSTRYVSAARAQDFTLTADVAVGAVREHAPDVVFLTSPNNPTGGALDLDVIAAVCTAAPGMVVVDEAYAEFSPRPSALGLLPDFPRLVVTRTMSKAFALAGARLGYFAASPDVIDAVRLVRLPYHLSAVTQAVALTALRHTQELLATVAAVREQRDRLVREIPALGPRVVPTDANFLLFGPFADPGVVWQALLDRGVLVRDVSSGPGLAGWLRVNAGTPAECDAFLEALGKVLADDPHAVEGAP